MQEELAKRVRKWLEQTGTTQRELATRLSITPVHLCNILQGNGALSIDMYERIMDVIGVRIRFVRKALR